MAPTAPNGGTTPTNVPSTDDVMSNIADVIESDDEFYDYGEGDGDTDTGGADTDTDASRSAPPVPDHDGTTQRRDAAPGDPELPMPLPHQQPPTAPQYDPDNPRGYARVGGLFADKEGNIVTRDGRIMAAKGEPARHWSNMSKAAANATTFQRQNEVLQRQIDSNKNLIDSAKELADLPQRLGVSREEYNLGVQLISAWNKNPLEVCRDMVARTMARGHNATDILGTEAGNAIEMTALRQLINEATAGQRQREEADRTIATQRTDAQQKYDAFIGRYPDAVTHADAIANLMNQNKIPAETAYHEIRYFALQHGFDFSQPLGPQVAARQAQERGQQPPNRQTQRAPMVNGGGGGNRDHLTNSANYADANASWGEILDSVMHASN